MSDRDLIEEKLRQEAQDEPEPEPDTLVEDLEDDERRRHG